MQDAYEIRGWAEQVDRIACERPDTDAQIITEAYLWFIRDGVTRIETGDTIGGVENEIRMMVADVTSMMEVVVEGGDNWMRRVLGPEYATYASQTWH